MTDFFVANFTGTGDLTAYTPDTGAALTSPSTANTFTGTYTTSSTLTAGYRVSTGSWQFVNASFWTPNFALHFPTTPSTADYYMEDVILLPATGNIACAVGHEMRGTRGAGGEAGYFDAIGFQWMIDETDSTHRTVRCFPTATYDQAATTYPLFASDPTPYNNGLMSAVIALGANASVKIRSEVEGNTLRAFVDDVLVLTDTWSGTTDYDAAGKLMWSYSFDTYGGTYTYVGIDSMKAGDVFLVIASDFWTGFEKTVEVFP